ncbi:MAG: hypothetical protein LBJ71_04290 [Holosporaceae bacterium]|jgi:hypothetical protein|nr:hypothetical protein [Holosporaceae bacterium]
MSKTIGRIVILATVLIAVETDASLLQSPDSEMIEKTSQFFKKNDFREDIRDIIVFVRTFRSKIEGSSRDLKTMNKRVEVVSDHDLKLIEIYVGNLKGLEDLFTEVQGYKKGNFEKFYSKCGGGGFVDGLGNKTELTLGTLIKGQKTAEEKANKLFSLNKQLKDRKQIQAASAGSTINSIAILASDPNIANASKNVNKSEQKAEKAQSEFDGCVQILTNETDRVITALWQLIDSFNLKTVPTTVTSTEEQSKKPIKIASLANYGPLPKIIKILEAITEMKKIIDNYKKSQETDESHFPSKGKRPRNETQHEIAEQM